jgi:hypothetical protein
LATLQAKGLITDSNGRVVPREIRRSRIKTLDEIGQGAFGAIFKASLDESAENGVPAYQVAVKMLKHDPNSMEKKEFMREAAISE